MDLTPKDIARFWSKVNKTDTCWLWTGWNKNERGVFSTFQNRKPIHCAPHRVSWKLCFGDIPNDMRLKQSCGNKLCVNPQHLYTISDLQNFWSKVKKTGTCWLWQGKTVEFGYGIYFYNNTHWKTHRLSWTLHFGKIPEGKRVLHECDVPACLNPDHLHLGDDADNRAEMISRGRQAKGENVPQHILTESEAIRIIQRLSCLKTPVPKGSKTDLIRTISQEYNVHIQTIWAIHYKRNWKHLPRK